MQLLECLPPILDVVLLAQIVGFETPHRLGSFANYVDNQTVTANAGGSVTLGGSYHMTFTPGVDGACERDCAPFPFDNGILPRCVYDTQVIMRILRRS